MSEYIERQDAYDAVLFAMCGAKMGGKELQNNE